MGDYKIFQQGKCEPQRHLLCSLLILCCTVPLEVYFIVNRCQCHSLQNTTIIYFRSGGSRSRSSRVCAPMLLVYAFGRMNAERHRILSDGSTYAGVRQKEGPEQQHQQQRWNKMYRALDCNMFPTHTRMYTIYVVVVQRRLIYDGLSVSHFVTHMRTHNEYSLHSYI